MSPPRSVFWLALWAAGGLAGCELGGDSTITVRFAALVGPGGPAVDCRTTYRGVERPESQLRIRDFRVFVSNLRLLGPSGTIPVELIPDGRWQTDSVALLDFEDGSEGCGESGNGETNATVQGVVSDVYRFDDVDDRPQLAFDVGLPAEENHLDITSRPAPLNLASMHWNWRGGYKFIRVDLEHVDPSNRYNVHLGSTGCEGPSPVMPPVRACTRPNRPRFVVDAFDPDSTTVVFDLKGLLVGSNTSTNAPDTNPGCMSGTNDPSDCGPVFENLGLAFDSGQCADDCANQRFVHAQ